MGQTVEGTLGQDGIVEEGDPLLDGPVGGDDGGASAVPLNDDLVEVAGLLGIKAAEAKVEAAEKTMAGDAPATDAPAGDTVEEG